MTTDEIVIRDEAWGWLEPVQTVQFATFDGNFPRVRPMSLILDSERFWLCTGTSDAKVAQLMDFPVFEFCKVLVGEDSRGTLRCSGTVEMVSDPTERSRMAKVIPFFKEYWEDPSDPSFCLIELFVSTVEYMAPGEMTACSFDV